jgi:sugar O-acyltransferase (sialic acid O-acetyltransferase NeuD family)
MKELWVIGSGGHAKVVIDTALAIGRYEVAGVLDDNEAKHGTTVLGVEIRAAATVESFERLGVKHAVVAIGDNQTRKRVVERFDGLVEWETLIHPTVHVAHCAEVLEGAVVFAGCVLQPESHVGRHAIINTLTTVDHECRVGDFAHLSAGIRTGGGTTVEEGALLGIASCTLPLIHVGEWAVVGAGSVVTRNVPPHAVVKGVPAK